MRQTPDLPANDEGGTRQPRDDDEDTTVCAHGFAGFPLRSSLGHARKRRERDSGLREEECVRVLFCSVRRARKRRKTKKKKKKICGFLQRISVGRSSKPCHGCSVCFGAVTEMAMSKVILLVGAGATGTIVLRNTKVSEILNDVSQVLSKHLKEDGDGSRGSGDGKETRALVAQVNQLTQELRNLASASRPITVVNGTSSSRTNLASLVMPAVVIGAVGYAYMWWRGFQWTDIMYVTRKHMSNAVSTVSKQLEQVAAALQATKRQLTAKLEGVSKTLNDSVEVQGLIKAQVTEVQGEVERVTVEIEEVQRLVQGLEVKIDEVQGKQDFANQGIVLLCRFVSSLEMFRQPELLQSYQSWTPKGHHALERSASAPGAALPAAGLKELQYFSETLAASIPASRDIPRDTAIANSNGGVSGVANGGTTDANKYPPNTGLHRGFSFAQPFGNS